MAPRYDADSVAAIITDPQERYLLQLRDTAAGIDFPGFWGLFGGARDVGEGYGDAIRRELAEELELHPARIRRCAALDFDQTLDGGLRCRRTYFEVAIGESEIGKMNLHEGRDMRFFSFEDLVTIVSKIIPYDACAILMKHLNGAQGDARGRRTN